MIKMIVCFGFGRNYVRGYCSSDLEIFIGEGTPVIVFDDEINSPEDFVEEYEVVA
ncbi:hypothetical protein [Marinimicrobium agarilyticum]|uniref:hypothetical protein n=1 Tax=Marinimicrobium agarilyticum TaxID=306546 RepID=UPI000425EE53|nr:hypothetical protein [Marinimicrobium agarilyticum]